VGIFLRKKLSVHGKPSRRGAYMRTYKTSIHKYNCRTNLSFESAGKIFASRGRLDISPKCDWIQA
jgi:hypothetical protein